ncbi:MAG: hypothetical protein KA715_11710 [Xanthomonadaceae bacterium]|nr:hypothetical protein [Xanthomonadaceae bacterium]
MSMYNRNAQAKNALPPQSASGAGAIAAAAKSEDNSVRINGFQQVLEMLRVADPSFRESLLRRMANTDPRMARMLRAQLLED